MNALFPWTPAASPLAGKVDVLLGALTALTGGVAVTIIALIIVFCLRYRHNTKADRTRAPADQRHRATRRIELAWTIIPLLLFLGVFVWAADLYYQQHAPPPDAQQVFIVAKQWMWKVQHADGRREIDQLHVPRGYPIKLVMTSQDVIHSFFVPAFRTKQDVLPGRYTTLWFTAERAGRFHLFCTEYCGTDHSRMTGDIVVMEPEEYTRWLASGPAQQTLAARGEQLFRTLGCSGCHGASATVHAPPLESLYGRPVALASGGTVIADELYIRDSILIPTKDVAAGYSPIMPSFAGQVSEEQILELIAYIESLRDSQGSPP
ncbi:MAG TPA: cytochrome c oxidase subunit II [Steroidobacteraceae bacterium]|nr:cytochrome c oxidase subunit II [Steroidobacteraceae bacterium]